MNAKTQALLTASMAGLVIAAGLISPGRQVQAAEEGKVPCYGINKCKGMGSCKGEGNACAGKNGCAGHGSIKLEKETCLKIQGGRLTPEEKKS